MKKLSIALALILCVALCVFCFASCGKKKADATTAAPGTTPTTTESSTTAPATTAEATTAPVTTAPHEHTPEADYTIDKPATCGEDGSKSIHCSECGNIIPGTEVKIDADPTLHVVDEWNVTKEATIFEDGVKTGTCTVCHQPVEKVIEETYNEYKFTTESTDTLDKSKNFASEILGEDKHFYPPEENPNGLDFYIEYSFLWNADLQKMSNVGNTKNQILTGCIGNQDAYFMALTTNAKGCDNKVAPGGFEYVACRTVEYGPAGMSEQSATGGVGNTYADFPNIGGTDQANPEYGWHRFALVVHEELLNEAALKADTEAKATAAEYRFSFTVYVDGVKLYTLSNRSDPAFNASTYRAENMLFTAESDGQGGVVYKDIDAGKSVTWIQIPTFQTTEGTAYAVYADEAIFAGSDFAQKVVKVTAPVDNVYTTADGDQIPAKIWYKLDTIPEPDLDFDVKVYNPADLSNYEGDKSMLLLSKTLPQIAGEDHFYPTEQNPAGKAVYFEFALLYNETMANSATDEFDMCLNFQGTGGKTLYVFVTKDNGSGWCKYAGGFDYANKKAILYGPEGGNAQPKENYPNMGNYGWHMIGVKFYQTAALDGDNVVYSGVSTLYVDGVKVWELDVDMSKFVLSGNKTLRLFDATNNAGVLEYADNPNAAKVRVQLRGEGINNSGTPMYFVYGGETWAIVDADYAPAYKPVADPTPAQYKLSDDLTVPASVYFGEPVISEPDLDFDVVVYNPADLSNFDGDKSMLLLSKTLPEIAGDDHFYPTEQNPDGKDAYFEFAVLWNETLANCANQYFQLCMNYKGGSGSILFYFIPKDNAPDTWCKFAGGFDWGRGKGDDPILFGPSGVEHGQKTDYPNIGEYGWHKIGFRFHQSAALSGENVVYSGVSSLYIDGVLVWQIDLNMDRIKSDKNLLFTATNNAGVLAYADNENAAKVRMQIRGEGINNSTDPTYFVFGGATWAIVDADWTPNVEPVADPTPAEYKLSDTLTVPASVYFQAKSN